MSTDPRELERAESWECSHSKFGLMDIGDVPLMA